MAHRVYPGKESLAGADVPVCLILLGAAIAFRF